MQPDVMYFMLPEENIMGTRKREVVVQLIAVLKILQLCS